MTPQLVKPAVAKVLNEIMAPIQEDFQSSKEWQEITLKAYPPPVKKEKKAKNRGTRFPGGQGGDAQKGPDGVPAATQELPIRTEKPTEN